MLLHTPHLQGCVELHGVAFIPSWSIPKFPNFQTTHATYVPALYGLTYPVDKILQWGSAKNNWALTSIQTVW